MATGTSLKRDDFLQPWSRSPLVIGQLKVGLRLIVIDGYTRRIVAEGFVTAITEGMITLRTTKGLYESNSTYNWGFPKPVASREENYLYDLNCVFAYKSTWWRRLTHKRQVSVEVPHLLPTVEEVLSRALQDSYMNTEEVEELKDDDLEDVLSAVFSAIFERGDNPWKVFTRWGIAIPD